VFTLQDPTAFSQCNDSLPPRSSWADDGWKFQLPVSLARAAPSYCWRKLQSQEDKFRRESGTMNHVHVNSLCRRCTYYTSYCRAAPRAAPLCVHVFSLLQFSWHEIFSHSLHLVIAHHRPPTPYIRNCACHEILAVWRAEQLQMFTIEALTFNRTRVGREREGASWWVGCKCLSSSVLLCDCKLACRIVAVQMHRARTICCFCICIIYFVVKCFEHNEPVTTNFFSTWLWDWCTVIIQPCGNWGSLRRLHVNVRYFYRYSWFLVHVSVSKSDMSVTKNFFSTWLWDWSTVIIQPCGNWGIVA